MPNPATREASKRFRDNLRKRRTQPGYVTYLSESRIPTAPPAPPIPGTTDVPGARYHMMPIGPAPKPGGSYPGGTAGTRDWFGPWDAIRAVGSAFPETVIAGAGALTRKLPDWLQPSGSEPSWRNLWQTREETLARSASAIEAVKRARAAKEAGASSEDIVNILATSFEKRPLHAQVATWWTDPLNYITPFVKGMKGVSRILPKPVYSTIPPKLPTPQYEQARAAFEAEALPDIQRKLFGRTEIPILSPDKTRLLPPRAASIEESQRVSDKYWTKWDKTQTEKRYLNDPVPVLLMKRGANPTIMVGDLKKLSSKRARVETPLDEVIKNITDTRPDQKYGTLGKRIAIEGYGLDNTQIRWLTDSPELAMAKARGTLPISDEARMPIATPSPRQEARMPIATPRPLQPPERVFHLPPRMPRPTTATPSPLQPPERVFHLPPPRPPTATPKMPTTDDFIPEWVQGQYARVAHPDVSPGPPIIRGGRVVDEIADSATGVVDEVAPISFGGIKIGDVVDINTSDGRVAGRVDGIGNFDVGDKSTRTISIKGKIIQEDALIPSVASSIDAQITSSASGVTGSSFEKGLAGRPWQGGAGTGEGIQALDEGSPLTWIARHAIPEERTAVEILKEILASPEATNIKKVTKEEITKERGIRASKGQEAYKQSVKAAEAAGKTQEEILGIGQRSRKSRLAGDLPDARLDFEKLNEQLGDANKQILFRMLRKAGPEGVHPAGMPTRATEVLSIYDHNNAVDALENLFSKGFLPTKYEAELLSKVFGDEFVDIVLKSRPGTIGRTGFRPMELLLDVLNMPRANVSSVDLSFLLRQGGMLFPSQLRQVRASSKLAMRTMKKGGDELSRGLQGAMQQTEGGRLWHTYVDQAGLFLHRAGGERVERLIVGNKQFRNTPKGRQEAFKYAEDTGQTVQESTKVVGSEAVGRIVNKREEAFMSTLAGRLPWVRLSERAYTTFLNKLRWDVMDDIVKRVEAGMGRQLDPANAADKTLLKDIANYINATTGRGPGLREAAERLGMIREDQFGGAAAWVSGIESIMNAVMFSPRLFTSRFAAPAYAAKNMRHLANLYPEAVRGDAVAREAYKDMSRTVAFQMGTWFTTGVALLGLAKMAERNGEQIEVELDWRSSDFGKIKAGGSRYDVWSGYTQIARAMGQLYSGESKSSGTGEIRSIPRNEVLDRFARSKFSPSMGMVSEYNLIPLITSGESFGKGQGFLGEDRDILKDMSDISPFKGGGNIPMLRIERGWVPIVDQESFWTKFFVPLFMRDLSDAVDQNISPLIPENVDANIAGSREPPGLLQGLITGIGSGLPAGLGLGVPTYTTLDDITEGITEGQPGGPVSYTKSQPYQRHQAQEIREQQDLEEGRTRTTGVGHQIQQNRLNESNQYNELANKIRTDPNLTTQEARKIYNNIKTEARITRQVLSQGLGGPEERQQITSTRSLPEQYAHDFYTRLDAARERQGGIPLTGTEYEAILLAWETEMINSDDPQKQAAVLTLRMMENRIDLPPEILNILTPGQLARYQAARILEGRHQTGVMPSELYG